MMVIKSTVLLAAGFFVAMISHAHDETHKLSAKQSIDVKQLTHHITQMPSAYQTIYHTNPVLATTKPTNHQAVQTHLNGLELTTGVRFNEQYLNQKIAQWSLQQVNGSLTLVEDPWVNHVVWSMTAKMNAQVRNQALLAVPVIRDNAINAFAVPGGLIGLNTGTILSAHALDEVASVLAHEIAHLSQRHYEHNKDNSRKLLALQLGGLLAAIAASAVSGDAAAAAIIGSQTATAENAAFHSREHEKEADRVGMQILVQAGYDAKAMPRFFERLHRHTALHQSGQFFVPSFMQSHPFTAERLSEATSRAVYYPRVSMADQESQAKVFDKLTWRLKYLTNQTSFVELTGSATQSVGAKLALVSYLADEGRTDEAAVIFQSQSWDTSDPLVCITHAHLLDKQKHYQKASDVLTSCQAVYPERRDLRLYLAQIWLKLNKPAHTLLSSLTDSTPHDVLAWKLIWQSYEKQALQMTDMTAKDMANIHALRARSQVQLWQGNYMAALQSNAQASQLLQKYQGYQSLQHILLKDKEQMVAARDFRP